MIIYFFLFISVIIGGSSVFLFGSLSKQRLNLLLSFSGAYLFAISVAHLLPDVYSSKDKFIGIYILLGFLLQIFLEFFSQGLEHGHFHIHNHHTKTIPVTILLGLCIHSFLEGMPLSGGIAGNRFAGNSLLVGIILHNLPISFALMSMFIQSEINKSKTIISMLFFASMAPLGMLVSYITGTNMTGDISIYFDRIMAIVVGIFLHISTTILFETGDNHRFNFTKFIIIIIGASFALLFSFVWG